MKFILGKKIEMTQQFKDNGEVVPVTVVQAGPCVITAVKNQEKDGHSAVQVGYGYAKKINKPLAGHLKNLGQFKHLKEFKVEEIANFKTGDKFDVSIFVPGDKVKVTGVSKGKGFQGVVKRHHFHGAPATHGHKDQERMPGSIGSGGVQRVFKGVRMGGHMGDDQVTVQNLEIASVDAEKNLLYIKGAVPGGRNSFLVISGDGEFKAIQPEVKVEEIKLEGVKTEGESGIMNQELGKAEETKENMNGKNEELKNS